MKNAIKTRNATIDDASDLSELSAQLGYQTSEDETKDRLRMLLNSGDDVVYVAIAPGGKAIGWIHAFKAARIESGVFAEIGGFIVAESFRGRGVGG